MLANYKKLWTIHWTKHRRVENNHTLKTISLNVKEIM